LTRVNHHLTGVKHHFARNAALALYSGKVLSVTEGERMIELLRYASQAKVAAALGVSRTTTGEWARGRNVTPFRLRQVEDLLRPQRAGEAALDPTNGELLTEMRAIRRLLQRQAKPAPAPLTTEQLVVAVVDALAQREAARPVAESRKRAPRAAAAAKGDRRAAPAR
jgi:hypothetical protein